MSSRSSVRLLARITRNGYRTERWPLGRSAAGRVRLDPRRARVLTSATVERPGALAVGAKGVFLTDFWRHGIRRFDPATLRQTGSLKLVLPFRVPDNKYAAFLPNDVAVGAGSVWV